MKVTFRYILTSLILVLACNMAVAQDDHSGHNHDQDHSHETTSDDHAGHDHADHAKAGDDHGGHGCACHGEGHEEEYDPGAVAFHHIADANSFHVFGDLYIPLPCMLYAPEHGWSFFMSSKFHIHHHGNGDYAVDNYVLYHGEVMRIHDESFPKGKIELDCLTHYKEGDKDVHAAIYQGQCYKLDKKSSFDGGLMGGGITSYYDFSITKNVFTMLMTVILLFFLFRSVAKAYTTRDGQAPKGLQGFMEPIFLFIRDEVAIPFLGHKYERFLPFLLTIFFFILGLNLIGQIPFFPGSGNVTGNLAVTAVLAVIAFIMTNFNGNSHYWGHVFWMPGVPPVIKALILTPVEILGLFIKPLTLMLRLFANITAGHIVIIIFVSLIFIFGGAGESVPGSILGGVIAVPLTLFMMAIELLVAFIQAFVFCILTASYIGAAVEEGHH